MSVIKRRMVGLNVIGGLAVLGSYALGLALNPETRGAVWGGVPDALRPVYTISMLAAAVGYLVFTGWLVFGVDESRLAGDSRVRFSHLSALYLAVLIPSALWMPLTFQMLEAPSDGLWWVIQAVLYTVAAGSVGLFAALVKLRARTPARGWLVALIGCAAFCFQTAVLDAFVWTAYFPA